MKPGTLARLLALYVCWGTSVPALKVMVETVPPLGGAAAVFLAGGGLLALLARRRERPERAQLRRAAVTGLLLLAGQGLATVALTELSASLTAILIASNALWAAVFGRFAGVPMDAATLVRLALGFTGIVVVIVSTPDAAIGGAPLAVAAALFSSVLWALGTVAAARGGALPRDALVTGSAQLLAGGALLAVVAAGTGELAPAAWEDASPRSLAAAAFLLAFDSLAGFLLYTSLVRSAPLGLVGTYAYAVPLVAVALGVLALGDEVSAGAAVGGAVALAAVIAQLRAAGPVRAAA
jgi:drug/metabolite transporter (DMT)-like permease